MGNFWSLTSKDPDIERDIFVTLEEVNTGCTKRVKITRVVQKNNAEPVLEETTVAVRVKAGCVDGDKIKFPYGGDKCPDKAPTDIVFVVRQKPHSIFRRNGNDIVYTAKITLEQALCGIKINVPLITGQLLHMDMSKEILTPWTVKVINGCGFPLPGNINCRGKMYLTFDVELPNFDREINKDRLIENSRAASRHSNF